MRILAVDDLHHSFEDRLVLEGCVVDYRLDINSKEELINQLKNYDVLVVRSKFFIDKEIIDSLPKSFVIVRAGAGMDNIDEEYCLQKNIRLINAPEGNRDAVAEHVIGMLISKYRNILKSHKEITQKQWLREENRGYELKGKTIGIIGFGNTGSMLAKKLSGFEMNIIAYDKYLTEINDKNVKIVSIKEIASKADIISLHVPLTSDTSHMINAEFLNSLEKSPFIINASRGKVIKTSDLVEALKNGKVMGAALDVLENERLETMNSDDNQSFNQLIASEKVLLTSHIAGWTFESYQRISEVLVQKLLRINL
jgi:D-3-phosphoglycerate dehydrogenase